VRVKLLLDRLGHRVEILIGEVQYCVAFDCQFEGYATGFWIDGFVEDAREQRMFDAGNTGQRVFKGRHRYMMFKPYTRMRGIRPVRMPGV
jgi:hypothetical protein